MKTYMATPSTIERKWYVIDAEGQTLGRLAAQVAAVLRGKHKPTYTPHVDCGDFVVVVNASKVALTGRKAEQKRLYRHTGYPGHLRSVTAGHMREKQPERLVERVIWGMLPKTKLGRSMYRKLKVYGEATHPHEAQQPETWNVVLKGDAR